MSDNHLVTVSCAVAVTAQVWGYLKSGLGSRNTVKFLEARDVIFIKNFTVFLLPKPDRKFKYKLSYFRNDRYYPSDNRSQLELGPPKRMLGPVYKQVG